MLAIATQYAVFRFTRGWPLRRRIAAVLATMMVLLGVFWLLRLAGY